MNTLRPTTVSPGGNCHHGSWGGEDQVCIRDEVAGSSSSPAPAPTENRVVGELGPEGEGAAAGSSLFLKSVVPVGEGKTGFASETW